MTGAEYGFLLLTSQLGNPDRKPLTVAQFRELFLKGIRTLEGSSKINLSATAVNSQLKRGNRGKFCILCCKFTQGKLRFRYMLANGNDSQSFQNVGLYTDLQEAVTAMSGFQKMYPDRAFEAVRI